MYPVFIKKYPNFSLKITVVSNKIMLYLFLTLYLKFYFNIPQFNYAPFIANIFNLPIIRDSANSC